MESSYLPALPQGLIVKGHYDGIDYSWTTVEALSCQNLVDLLLFVSQLALLLLEAQASHLILSLVGPYVQSIHEREPARRIFNISLIFPLPGYSVFESPYVL